jgi:hypothetical protein
MVGDGFECDCVRQLVGLELRGVLALDCAFCYDKI